MLENLLAYNRRFVAEKRYLPYRTGKYPRLKIAILTCMDTRLVTLLPAALGLQNGDVKIIKNAGATVSSLYGGELRSLLVAVYELGVETILVIGHTDCGVQRLNGPALCQAMAQRGIHRETIARLTAEGVDFDRWLAGFSSVENSVRETVKILRTHPLLPPELKIWGGVMDTETGALQMLG